MNITDQVKRVEKPWGYELWWALTEKYVGKILHVDKGQSLSYQYHEKKDETIYLHSGELLLEIEEVGGKREEQVMKTGSAISAPSTTPLTIFILHFSLMVIHFQINIGNAPVPRNP